jgi:polyhydroxyalkanoate synthase subunit PhaC
LAIDAAPISDDMSLAPIQVALQQRRGPRPLPLFIDIARQEAGDDAPRLAAILIGLDAYQRAPRAPPRSLAPIVARHGRAVLRDYGGAGPPMVFVPSLINPPTILDLTPDHSLLRWMAAQGFHVLLVDWGTPEIVNRGADIGYHVTDLLVPLLRQLNASPLLVGYCLGGTMAIAAAALAPVRALALIASPWHFAGFPDAARADQAKLWDTAAPAAEMLGVLPMEVLQSGFWRLDPARTIGKFVGFDRLDPNSAKARLFIAVEDWANEGPPLTFAAAREAFEDLFAADVTGQGRWCVGGRVIDPKKLACPVLDIVSTTDRIVPAAAACRAQNSISLALGHVGMIVGSAAHARLWQPLRDWLKAA